LEEIDAQHPFQSDGRVTALVLGIERFDDGEQLVPREDLFHAREELLAAGGLLFGGKLGLGKTGLMDHVGPCRKSNPPRLQ
jgi:hypothetical protein